MAVALRLVESKQFCDQVDVDLGAGVRGVHSLQGAFAHALPWQPSIARYVLDRFSERGDFVLDSFCDSGHVGLECLQAGRHFVGSSHDRALARLATARLDPADLGEVALRLQLVNLKRPVDVRGFTAPFTMFFDVDTFCELVNLRSLLTNSSERVDRFLQFIVAGVIHGHTVGHLSGYTSPNVALSQDAQAQLNSKRGEVPSYRAVAPRILRKAAALLQDGIPSVLQQGDLSSSIIAADPRNLSKVGTASIGLAMTCLDQPGFVENTLSSWLRAWWLGIDASSGLPRPKLTTTESWRMYCNEVLLETARVVRRGGRTVVRAGHGRVGSKVINYREELSAVLNEGLGGYWATEGTIVERHVNTAGLVKNSEKKLAAPGELVVLRRK